MDVIRKLIKEDEKILWQGRPNIKENKLIESNKFFIIFSIFTSIIISFPTTLLLFIMFPHFTVLLLFPLLSIFLWNMIMVFGRGSKKYYFRNLEYILTNERIITIWTRNILSFKWKIVKILLIIELPEIINYFFVTNKKNHMLNDLNFKILLKNENQMKKIFLEVGNNEEIQINYKFINNFLEILKHSNPIPFILSWQNLKILDELNRIITDMIPNKLIDPPNNWMKENIIFRK
ncbi:MAG: hypothetical protein ACTSVK_07450 [Promethearchaeota archaeon]